MARVLKDSFKDAPLTDGEWQRMHLYSLSFFFATTDLIKDTKFCLCKILKLY